MPLTKSEKVAVIGIGRVGLPLALVLAQKGNFVYGLGRDEEKIEQINKGKMPFHEDGAATLLKKVIKKKFIAATDYSVISKCNYIILTLGTPIDENMNPSYSQINSAFLSAKKFFKKNQVLILRSTVSPRTTKYVESMINDITGFEVGKNFFLAFCPERIAEGKSLTEILTIPQIVGGVDKKSTKLAANFFRNIGVEVIETDDVSAELAKLFTNMYRYINFAISNEFMVLAGNYHRDIHNIIGLVNHNYKRGGLALPGLTGGPCLFKDGFFLINDLPFADLISTSWKINESVPILLVKRIRERMKLDGKKVALLGLAFKSEIDDIRESLSFKIRKALVRERANVVLHDPFVKEYPYQEIEKDVYKAVEGADLIFIATRHKAYEKLDISKIKKIVKKGCMVCDIWNVMGTGKIIYKLGNVTDDINVFP